MTIESIKKRCTGCSSCVSICPHKAITFLPDEEGFLYPHVNEHKCLACGICLTKCPVAEANDEHSVLKAYYGYCNDETIVMKSSSGGAFSAMADFILKNGGLVIGAAINYDNFDVEYKSTDECDIDALRRSKYVSSYPNAIFAKVKKELSLDRIVLFVGLPCHVAGLKKYLSHEYDNLILCDFICGGVASPSFFKEHLKHLEKKYRSKIKSINFRAKLFGWRQHSEKIVFANGKEYNSLAIYDSFFQGYFEKQYQRDSCYHCRYRLTHVSDVIIADYWGGIEKNRVNNVGTSMVLANSQKGLDFCEDIFLSDNRLSFYEMPIEDANYVFKTEKERYDKAEIKKKDFYCLWKRYGFEKAAKKTYLKGMKVMKSKAFIRKVLHIQN